MSSKKPDEAQKHRLRPSQCAVQCRIDGTHTWWIDCRKNHAPAQYDHEVVAAMKIRECTCVDTPERDDSGVVLHASYCLVAIAGRARTPFGPGEAPNPCYICGDPDDHLGLPHGEVTGDSKTRADIDGGVYAEHKRLQGQVEAVRQFLDQFKEEPVSAMLLYTWIRAVVGGGA